MGFLTDRRILITGVLSSRSIAYGIARACQREGATLAFTFVNDDLKERVVKLAADFGPSPVLRCDVSKDEDIETFFSAARDQFGKIDFLVHSLAFADKAYLEKGNFATTPREVFKQALDISAYSLIALARGAAAMMPDGGSIIALTYLGSEKVVPGYNVMGVAKAALESSARYLAFELGEKKIRVNTLSAGPVPPILPPPRAASGPRAGAAVLRPGLGGGAGAAAHL